MDQLENLGSMDDLGSMENLGNMESLGSVESLGSISTRPCVRSRQVDYGHVLIPPIQADEPRNALSRHTRACFRWDARSHTAGRYTYLGILYGSAGGFW